MLKIGAGIIFIEIYTHHYGSGTLSADAEQFLREGRVLNEVFHDSKKDYINLLFGFDENGEIAKRHLEKTHHWDSNSQLIFNDNRNLMRVHSLIHFISFGEVYVHLCLLVFCSLLGIFFLSKVTFYYVKRYEVPIFWILLLVPSVMFWTSSVLKEPLLFLGICLSLYALIIPKTTWKKIIAFVIGSLFILAFKPYILLCLLPAVLLAFAYQKIKFNWFAFSVLALICFATLTLLYTSIGENFTKKLSKKQFDFINISQGGIHLLGNDCFYYIAPDSIKNFREQNDSIFIDKPSYLTQFEYGYTYTPKLKLIESGSSFPIFFRQEPSTSYIEVTRIDNKGFQLLKNIPSAIFNTLFRPLPSDSGSWLIVPASIETLALWLIIFLAIKRCRNLERSQVALVIGIFTFILTLALLIGWVTPVQGAINRYRTPIFLGIAVVGIILWFTKKKTHETNSAN